MPCTAVASKIEDTKIEDTKKRQKQNQTRVSRGGLRRRDPKQKHNRRVQTGTKTKQKVAAQG